MAGFPSPGSDAAQDPDQLFQESLRIIAVTIQLRLKDTPRPVLKTKGRVNMHRFPEKDLDTYLLLKLVQFASNLRAGKKLIDHGFTYEWKMLHRVISESTEDVYSLLLATLKNSWEKTHEDVLAAFFLEDFNARGKVSKQQPIHFSRNAVRNAIHRSMEETNSIPDEFSGKAGDVMNSLHKIKSGYVHGRAASLMSLYDNETNRFATGGKKGHDAAVELKNLWRATYLAMGCASLVRYKWFGPDSYKKAWELADRFRQAAGVAELLDGRVSSVLSHK